MPKRCLFITFLFVFAENIKIGAFDHHSCLCNAERGEDGLFSLFVLNISILSGRWRKHSRSSYRWKSSWKVCPLLNCCNLLHLYLLLFCLRQSQELNYLTFAFKGMIKRQRTSSNTSSWGGKKARSISVQNLMDSSLVREFLMPTFQRPVQRG